MFKAIIPDGNGGLVEVVEGEVKWGELDPTEIQKLALCNDEGAVLAVIERPDPAQVSSFQEFIQYKTAHVKGVSASNMATDVVAQVGGWTDGKFEYVVIVDIPTERVFMNTLPRMHYHPKSIDNPNQQKAS